MADGKSVKANEDFFDQQAQDLPALLHIQRLRTGAQLVAKSTHALGRASDTWLGRAWPFGAIVILNAPLAIAT